MIGQHYPEASFRVSYGEDDSTIVQLVGVVDIEDTDPVLDVVMDEDHARNRKDHGPQNLALLRKLALNLAKLEPSKGIIRGKLK